MDLHMDSYSAHYAQCPMPQNLDSFDLADLFDSLLRVFLRILMYGEKVNNFVYFSLPHIPTGKNGPGIRDLNAFLSIFALLGITRLRSRIPGPFFLTRAKQGKITTSGRSSELTHTSPHPPMMITLCTLPFERSHLQ
jgi:hypothetical protein